MQSGYAIIVGARCAGASTATLLARKGHRVLLVDRARFPSEIAHGHFIHRDRPPRLARWGLLDRIVATGCPPLTTRNAIFDAMYAAGAQELAATLARRPEGIDPHETSCSSSGRSQASSQCGTPSR